MLCEIIEIYNLKTGKKERTYERELMFLPEWGFKQGEEFVMSKMATSTKIETREKIKHITIMDKIITVITDSREYIFEKKEL